MLVSTMSTIKDVARLAGVSLGTVSNVLNERKAVNPEKARRVQEAIDALNYKPHQSARSLKTSKSMNVAVVLPDILDPMRASLFTGIERVLSQQGYAVSLYTTSEVSAKETAIIERVLEQRADGLIISTCQPENEPLFSQLLSGDTTVVLIERAVHSADFHLVEFDNYASIFRLTSDLFSSGNTNNVLISGHRGFSSEDRCMDAFAAACREQGVDPAGRMLTSGFNKENAFKEFTRYLQKNSLPDNVITTGTPLMNGVIKALEMQAVEHDKRPCLFSLSEENWAGTLNSDFTAVPRRPIALGEAAAELLLAEMNSERPADIISRKISNLDFRTAVYSRNGASTDTNTIKVLMLNSPAYKAVKSLSPDFERKYGIKTEFTALEYGEMSSVISDENSRSAFDVLQIDIPWLPDLVQSDALLELGDYNREVENISKEFIPGVLSAYSKFNDGIYALPFMFGTQLLYYRKDLFEDSSIKLGFKEKYGFDLRVPKTWTEFNLIAEYFTKSFNPGSPVEYGTTLGGKLYSGAVCEFLPRMWAYGGSILDSSGRLNPDTSAFQKSLNAYRESYKYADPDSADYWWDEQLRDFKSGKAAMMIMFIAHAVDLADAADSVISGKIGYDVIPGGNPLLGGWSIGINSASRKQAEAFSFISWAASKELAIPQTILGGSTASISLYKSSELLTIYPWLPKAVESFNISRKREISRKTTAGRLSEKDFEIILGRAVHDAVSGKMSTEEAVDYTLKEISSFL